MNNEVLTQLLLGIISVIGALITAYVCPYLKSRVSEKNLNTVVYFADMAVKCANQIFPPDKQEEKKAFVIRKITEIANDKGVGLREDQIDLLIEGIVNEVKKHERD